ncbi:DNA repair protein RAD51 homolog 4 isoform X1 [Macaca mulatta]
MALQARSSPGASLEPGSGSAARPGWRALEAGIPADPGRADNPQPYPWCRLLLPPSSSCSQRACVPSRKGWKRGVWRGPRECPRDWQSSLGLFQPAGNMGVLRVGLCPGLTQEMIQLLRSRRIKTVVDLVSADLEEVAQKCGLSYKALVALRRVLLAQFSAFPLNGADLYEELKTSTAILSTGIGSLDKLLDAGLYTGEVTEIVGGPGSGKTQVCLCVAANVAHGLQQNILYVDSNGGLTASRLLQLLQTKTQDEEEQAEALQRIQVVHAFDIFQMLDVLQELRGTVAQQVTGSSGTMKVVVVDSVTAVVSPLLGGQQREGLALMMQLARELKTLARDLGMAVVVTNHITRDRDSGRLKPALGRSWSFVPSTRILLDTIEGAGASAGRRMACLTKSPRQWKPSSPWLGASRKRHAGDWMDNPVHPHCVLCSLLAQWRSRESL